MQPVERRAGELAPRHGIPRTTAPTTQPCAKVAISEPMKNDRSQCLRLVRRGEPEFERHAAEDQPEQQASTGKYSAGKMIEKAVGKVAKDSDPDHYEPRLVAVPERRDRCHQRVARRVVGREGEKNADTEVEAVEQHVQNTIDSAITPARERAPGADAPPRATMSRLACGERWGCGAWAGACLPSASAGGAVESARAGVGPARRADPVVACSTGANRTRPP